MHAEQSRTTIKSDKRDSSLAHNSVCISYIPICANHSETSETSDRFQMLTQVTWKKKYGCCRFLAGSTSDKEANKRRDGVVKLIPQVSKGPWFVKQAVGTTPCLLGRKLTALYHRQDNFLLHLSHLYILSFYQIKYSSETLTLLPNDLRAEAHLCRPFVQRKFL